MLSLADVVATASAEAAFKDIDIAVLVGAMPRREGMERKDLLKANVKIFRDQGSVLDRVAKKSVKVLSLTQCFVLVLLLFSVNTFTGFSA